jgi:phosphoglycerate dehydrogenase-like enzyme
MLVLFDAPDSFYKELHCIAPDMHVDHLSSRDPGYPEALSKADIIAGWLKSGDLHKATQLRWLQMGSAGANRFVDILPPDVILTNASGVFGIPIAEHVLAMMLAFARGIPESVRAAAKQEWPKAMQLHELYGATCGIIGLGDIGTEVARRAKAFGMRTLAVKRTVTERPDFVDEVWDIAGLDRLLSESQHVVITLPGTPHTHHMIDARRLSLVQQGSFIYNIGRGSVIDEDALVQALSNGYLAGAGLDVFETEPLPQISPLWYMPNVIVTPHVAGSTPQRGVRLAQIILRNVPRYLTGQKLENEVDRQWGY